MFSCLGKDKFVPLLKVKDLHEDDALRVVEALQNGGINIMELIFRRHSDSIAIRRIAKEFPEFIIGAGNILNGSQLIRAVDCKARFATAPGLSGETINIAKKHNIMFAPGVTTPTELERVLLSGCVDFQFFPAEQAGGVDYLRAIIEPFEHLPIEVFPKGGITADNAAEYLKLSYVSAVSLSGIVTESDIVTGNWQGITEAAKRITK
ncbi:MAG: hypothetical protein L3J71_09775 [Victivallaceae bacterium]|nr:hypothetical protein [Victivallaceae bacterium]